jgi:ankyrin repeat protein
MHIDTFLRCAVVPVVLCSLLGCRLNAEKRHADRPELTPLMNAAMHNDLLQIQKLISQGADVHQRTKQGETALYEAIARLDLNADNLPAVDALLKAGADPNEVETYNMHPLEISLTRDYGNPSVTLLLIRSGAHVSRTCGESDSLLSLATQDSSLEVMRALIAKGAPVNCLFRETALHWAAMNGETDRVALLLQGGADPQLRNSEGKTALDVATTTNPEPRVQADFAKTRKLLQSISASGPAH